MSRFAPVRASTPPKSTRSHSTTITAPTVAPSTHSRSSAVSAPELSSLTPDQIDFIEAVISRASPSATTFLTVFKAYNDVLNDRGLDPANEVVYYGKLLKLGTLKGKNWGDKWDSVKERCGYVSSAARAAPKKPAPSAPVRAKAHPTEATTSKLPLSKPTAAAGYGRGGRPAETKTVQSSAGRLLLRLRNLQHHRQDSDHTEPSVIDGTEATPTEVTDETDMNIPRYQHLLAVPKPIAHTPATTSAFTSTFDSMTPSSYPLPPQHRPPPRWPSPDTDTFDETAPSVSTKPPSYKTTARDVKAPLVAPRAIPAAQTHTRARSFAPPITSLPPKAPRTPPPLHKRGSAINEDEAWNKVKMMQDEKEADRFREEKLIERCWDVWKQGYDWIVTTSEQISQARDTLLLRLAIQKWRQRLQAVRDLSARVETLHSQRVLSQCLIFWNHKLKVKQRNDRHNAMRAKMKLVRQSRESKITKDAWAKWRQMHQSRLGDQHYEEWVVRRFFGAWKRKLAAVDGLEGRVEEFRKRRDGELASKALEVWKRSTELRMMEGAVASAVARRMVKDVVEVWKRRMSNYQKAEDFHESLILKGAMRTWKAAQGKIRALERRADKHLARQDDVLVRALTRIWKARERGQLLQRVRSMRLLRQAWAVWIERIRANQEREEKALAFSLRANSALATNCLRVWNQHLTTHRNAHAFAVQYHSVQLQYRTLFQWRVKLRERFKLVKQAKMAEKFFVQKKAWTIMKAKLEERRREKKLSEWEKEKTKKVFVGWLQKALRQRHHRLAEQELRARFEARTKKNVLTKWTNRVIELKLRELDVAQKADKMIVNSAFTKWKGVCIRHVEELSLMESYQDVKREENMRRMFYKWLTAARTARHRRVVLQEKEQEMKRYMLASAWDRWRGAYKTEKLRPVERMFTLQNQNALMYRGFVTWHAKTKSLPAVRFHASNTKAKFWKVWRDAMPHALQAKKAREMDKKATLSKALEKWIQAHRTKIALRAVARARYMRLPTAAPRPVTSALSRPLPQPSSSRVLIRPRPRPPSPDPTTEVETDADNPPRPAHRPVVTASAPIPTHVRGPSTARSKPPGSRTGIASLLSSRPHNTGLSKLGKDRDRDSSPTRDRPRFTTRSVVSGGTRNSSPTKRGRDLSPTRTAPVMGPGSVDTMSEAGGAGGAGRSAKGSLWTELKEIQRKSRTPTVRSFRSTPDPP